MNIVTWNVNGIRSRIFSNASSLKKNEIVCEQNSAMSKLISETNPDIICIQETRCSKVIGDSFKLDGYHSIFNESKLTDARGPNRYSGTAVFTKIKPKKIEYQIPNYNDEEGRIIILDYDDFILINVYVPNSGSNYEKRKEFNTAFLEFFKQIDKPLIFCGDMNMAIDTYFDKNKVKPMPGIYPHELDFYHKITTQTIYGGIFNDSIDKTKDNIIYTWWNPRCKKITNPQTNLELSAQRIKNHGWRLDYIFTRKIKSYSSKVLKHIGEYTDPQGSDHAPVFGEFVIQ